MPPSCSCFSLCNILDMSAFQLRLPIVRSKASPWYTYLTHVYSSDVPLPFDVAQLELFYPAVLPTSMCGQNMPVLPRCNAGECRSWVDQSRHPSADGRMAWARGRKHFYSPPILAEDAMRQRAPWSQFVVLQEAVRFPAPDDAWAEVTRMKPHLDPEGVGIGCWFYPARGAGVFVHVGRTQVFRTRNEAVATPGFGNATISMAAGGVEIGHDHNLARGAEAKGFDSVQVLHGNAKVIYGGATTTASLAAHPTSARELILATRACMTSPAKSPCVAETTLTGWGASRPCRCAESPRAGAASINCLASGGDGGVRSGGKGMDARAKGGGGGGGAKVPGARAAVQPSSRPNHGSPFACNVPMLNWVTKHIAAAVARGREQGRRAVPFAVLDVGGGTGEVGRQVLSRLSPAVRDAILWRTIDVVAQPGTGVERFNGRHLPVPNRSVDLVLFNWVFHHASTLHAGDSTSVLLDEATRAVRPRSGRLLVVEDLRGDNPGNRHHQDTQHSGCSKGCVFRSDEEWLATFASHQLEVVHRETPPRDCLSFYQIPRAMYVLGATAAASHGRESRVP